jgi:DNA-binding MarR family transcriptional regulator
MSSRPPRAAGPSDPDPLGRYSLQDTAGHLLRRCQQRAVDIFMEEVGPDGPTPRQYAVLLCAYQNPGLNQTDLVGLSGIDRSTLTEILRRLAAKGLVRRERTSEDQRANALFITEAGTDLLRRHLGVVDRVQTRIMAAIPAEKRAETLDLLRLMSGDEFPRG